MKHIQSENRPPDLGDLLKMQQDSFERALGWKGIRLVPRPVFPFPKQKPGQPERDTAPHHSRDKCEDGEGLNETE